jgi:hypothetical protein
MSRSAATARPEVAPAEATSRPAAAAGPRHPGYLFHPLTDFLMAGGGSMLVAAPVFWLIRDKAAAQPAALWLSLVLSVFINYPHFAHSYQLLYAGIGQRILGRNTTRKVSLKYVWAGFVAPALIGAFLLGAYLSGNVVVLGYAANAVFFSVGWHYVKQGYGVITVLSAVRRIYYSDVEKKLLLLNGYTVWIQSWMMLNVQLREQTYYGVKYFLLDLPPMALTIGYAATALTTLALAAVLARRVARRQPVSWNGIVGYVCSLYLWVVAFYADPIFTLFVPAFHSLQYLLFVWRYQVNKAHAETRSAGDAPMPGAKRTVVMKVARFVLVGMVLGFIGFMALPTLLEASLAPDPAVWGGTVFVFILSAFINLHHYFIDNVIWRRDNEDVRRYLFAPR